MQNKDGRGPVMLALSAPTVFDKPQIGFPLDLLYVI